MASASHATSVRWTVDSENFQWDLPDQSGRFYVPDIAVSHPGASTPAEERAAIALIVEVTSPASADTVYNDRVVKPPQAHKGSSPGFPGQIKPFISNGPWPTLFGSLRPGEKSADKHTN